jgi:[protein-PII] uridylyltransferase
LNDEHVRETFLTILERRGEVAPVLRAMHEVNLLGKYIPEFGRLTCLVQHEFYHQYAADEHTLVCLEQLDKIWEAKNEPYKHYAPLFQSLERPGLLYLALLLHDVGKAEIHKRGNHPKVSAEMAMRAAKRLLLDDSASHCCASSSKIICSWPACRNGATSTTRRSSAILRGRLRRRGAEPAHAADLCRFAGHQRQALERLQGFAALAVAFARDDAAHRRHGIRPRRGKTARAARRKSANSRQRIADEEVDAHFATLPPRYFEIHTPKEILDDLELAHRFHAPADSRKRRALSPVTAWLDEPDRGYNLVKICTWDRAGLFSKIAGSLSASGLNILGAQIFTRADGIALDTFFVNDARTGNLAAREQHDKFAALLEKVLIGDGR